MGALLSLIAHTELFFPLLLVGLLLVVEAGFRVRRASPGVDPEIQSAVESARDRLTVLLALLLGFSLPMALPHYEQRNQLVTDEADAISTVAQRAQMLSEPYREKILQALGEYIDARLEFASADLGGPQMMAAVNHAKHLQNEMWLQSVPLIPQTPMFAQSVDRLSDLIEERLAAAERRIPDAIWLVFILISVLACFVVGYSMRCRVLLGMLVLPLTVAIVLSLVSELDNPHAGVIRVSQKSMLRIQQDLKAQAVPADSGVEGQQRLLGWDGSFDRLRRPGRSAARSSAASQTNDIRNHFDVPQTLQKRKCVHVCRRSGALKRKRSGGRFTTSRKVPFPDV